MCSDGERALAFDSASAQRAYSQLLKAAVISVRISVFGMRRMENAQGKPAFPAHMIRLLTQTQLCDEGAVTLDILLLQVFEQAAALTDHLVQAAAGVVVLLVDLQVFGELVDALGEDSHLDFGRTGVGGVGAVVFDDRGLLIFEHHCGCSTFHKIRRSLSAGPVKSRKTKRRVEMVHIAVPYYHNTGNLDCKEKLLQKTGKNKENRQKFSDLPFVWAIREG